MKKKQIIKQLEADIVELRQLKKLKTAYENELSLLNYQQSMQTKQKHTVN